MERTSRLYQSSGRHLCKRSFFLNLPTHPKGDKIKRSLKLFSLWHIFKFIFIHKKTLISRGSVLESHSSPAAWTPPSKYHRKRAFWDNTHARTQKRATYVSEAIPVFDFAAVLGDGWQPLLVFHEIPRFAGFFRTFHIHLEREAHQQAQGSGETHGDHVGRAVRAGMDLLLMLLLLMVVTLVMLVVVVVVVVVVSPRCGPTEQHRCFCCCEREREREGGGRSDPAPIISYCNLHLFEAFWKRTLLQESTRHLWSTTIWLEALKGEKVQLSKIYCPYCLTMNKRTVATSLFKKVKTPKFAVPLTLCWEEPIRGLPPVPPTFCRPNNQLKAFNIAFRVAEVWRIDVWRGAVPHWNNCPRCKMLFQSGLRLFAPSDWDQKINNSPEWYQSFDLGLWQTMNKHIYSKCQTVLLELMDLSSSVLVHYRLLIPLCRLHLWTGVWDARCRRGQRSCI